MCQTTADATVIGFLRALPKDLPADGWLPSGLWPSEYGLVAIPDLLAGDVKAAAAWERAGEAEK